MAHPLHTRPGTHRALALARRRHSRGTAQTTFVPSHLARPAVVSARRRWWGPAPWLHRIEGCCSSERSISRSGPRAYWLEPEITQRAVGARLIVVEPPGPRR